MHLHQSAYRGPGPTGHSPSRCGTTASRAAQTQTQRATRMSGTTSSLSDYQRDVPSVLQHQRIQRRSSYSLRYRSTNRAPAMRQDATPPSPTGPGIRAKPRIMALSVPHYCTFVLSSEPVTKARIRKRSRYALHTLMSPSLCLHNTPPLRASKPCRILSPR